jgi:hypothetical protein
MILFINRVRFFMPSRSQVRRQGGLMDLNLTCERLPFRDCGIVLKSNFYGCSE